MIKRETYRFLPAYSQVGKDLKNRFGNLQLLRQSTKQEVRNLAKNQNRFFIELLLRTLWSKIDSK